MICITINSLPLLSPAFCGGMQFLVIDELHSVLATPSQTQHDANFAWLAMHAALREACKPIPPPIFEPGITSSDPGQQAPVKRIIAMDATVTFTDACVLATYAAADQETAGPSLKARDVAAWEKSVRVIRFAYRPYLPPALVHSNPENMLFSLARHVVLSLDRKRLGQEMINQAALLRSMVQASYQGGVVPHALTQTAIWHVAPVPPPVIGACTLPVFCFFIALAEASSVAEVMVDLIAGAILEVAAETFDDLMHDSEDALQWDDPSGEGSMAAKMAVSWSRGIAILERKPDLMQNLAKAGVPLRRDYVRATMVPAGVAGQPRHILNHRLAILLSSATAQHPDVPQHQLVAICTRVASQHKDTSVDVVMQQLAAEVAVAGPSQSAAAGQITPAKAARSALRSSTVRSSSRLPQEEEDQGMEDTGPGSAQSLKYFSRVQGGEGGIQPLVASAAKATGNLVKQRADLDIARVIAESCIVSVTSDGLVSASSPGACLRANPNEYMLNHKPVILAATTCVSVGVSFTVHLARVMLFLGHSTYCTPELVLQVMYRVRQLVDGRPRVESGPFVCLPGSPVDRLGLAHAHMSLRGQGGMEILVDKETARYKPPPSHIGHRVAVSGELPLDVLVGMANDVRPRRAELLAGVKWASQYQGDAIEAMKRSPDYKFHRLQRHEIQASILADQSFWSKVPMLALRGIIHHERFRCASEGALQMGGMWEALPAEFQQQEEAEGQPQGTGEGAGTLPRQNPVVAALMTLAGHGVEEGGEGEEQEPPVEEEIAGEWRVCIKS
jgi:hypothetical protein